jgi:amino acid adenylation domain-containing protein
MDRLIDHFVRGDSANYRGLIHLWNLDAPAAASLESEQLSSWQDRGVISLLHLVQAWDAAVGRVAKNNVPPVSSSPGDSPTLHRSPRLLVVTRGAQAAQPTDEVEIAQSPVIGLGRVLMSEYAGLTTKLVDLPPDGDEAAVVLIEAELALGDESAWSGVEQDEEDEVAWRNGQRLVHRFHLAKAPAISRRAVKSPFRLGIRQPGTFDGLQFQTMKRRTPEAHEVEIKVAAAALNFSDVMKALGLYPGVRDKAPRLGAECSGVITQVGVDVDDLRVGDEVLAVAPHSFASHVVTRAELVARKPSTLSFEQAAAVPIAFLTAYYAMEYLGRLQPGERVLIHSASGGVGLAAIQLARRIGAEIFTTAGSEEKRDFLRKEQIEHVANSRTLEFAEDILRATQGKGVDMILNSLVGEAIPRGIEILADYGRFLEIGKRDIYRNLHLGLRPFRNNLSFFGIDLDQLMQNRPELLGRFLQCLGNDFEQGNLLPLRHQVFPATMLTEAFRWMQQGKHIGKIVISMSDGPEVVSLGDDEVLQFRADASYLITGGLGGFGLALARWMIDRGARNLVLMGRRAVDSDAVRNGVAKLQTPDVNIVVCQGDVTRGADVASVLNQIHQSLPPLKGVFHAAMVLEDGVLQNLDRDWMLRVMAPKVVGGWNLHEQTRSLELDYFVLFSSLSSVFGHPGQGNYAAANAFLDQLAHHRRSASLPCLTVNWGYLGDVGYLAERPQLGERLNRQGILSFTVRQALDCLERSLLEQRTQLSVMNIDWRRWRGLGVSGSISRRFRHLLSHEGDSPETASGIKLTATSLRELPRAQRTDSLGDMLVEKISQVLGVECDRLDRTVPLLDLGLDSLMAVELRNWIESRLRINLPIVELVRGPSLNHVAERLSERIGEDNHHVSPSDKGKPLAKLPESNLHRETSFPLSRGQRGLWFLSQLDSAGTACNIHFASRIQSTLNLDVFQRALQYLVDRHPSLRTTFHERNGEVLQTVQEEMTLSFQLIAAESWSEPQLREHLDREIHRPFDLQTGPLFRAFLFVRGPAEYVFLATSHHLVLDFWSVMILWKDVMERYPIGCGDSPLPRPTPPAIHFGSFVQWQEKLLQSDRASELRAFWLRSLHEAPSVLEVPVDFPRPAHFSHIAGTVPCRIPDPITRRMMALATEEKVTLYVALLAAFQVLLGRHTGEEDFLIGSPFSGRSRPDFADMVGCFINLVPLRARLSTSLTFRQLLRQVSESVWDALQHQDYPFPLMVESLGVKHDLSRHPLVQVSFTLEKSQFGSEMNTGGFLFAEEQHLSNASGLRQKSLYVEQRTCQMDLEWVLERTSDGLSGILRYCASLYRKETAERLVERFEMLLADASTFPDRPLGDLKWFTDSERKVVVEDWNQTTASFPMDLCLHELFERQAKQRPSAVALRCPDRTYTYHLLERAANQWAWRLVELGVSPGSRVGLCFETSAEMVVAILATLKAGAAYVPLDPRTPMERQRRILDDASVALLLTSPDFVPQLPDNVRHVIEVRQLHEEELLAKPDPGPPVSGVNPTDVAYLIYTSGSTGQPKGVLVEHQAICNTVLWRQQDIPLDPTDRSLWIIPYFFDPSVALLFQNFAAGAELVIPESGEELHPPRLVARIAMEGVTAVTASPRLLSVLVNEPAARQCRTIRHVLCGGESPPSELAEQVRQCWKVSLVNLYGPTEAAVEATWWRCEDDSQAGTIPMGRPIANMRAYVLDEDQRPLPVGVPGEIYLGGRGLARGYLHDAELTARRFIPDPFSRDARDRLYRTGDYGRWLHYGCLEFLGRWDEQIKLRGYRIEPGEVESCLVGHPAVREAAVVARVQASESQQLGAFVVMERHAPRVDPAELQDYLRGRLPGYMVPEWIQSVTTLPRMATGKLDRRRLETMPLEVLRPVTTQTAPQTPLEVFLASVWCELLHVDEMGREVNFYELGGTSLQGAMFVSRLQQELDQRLPLITVFELPTIADLARFLANAFPEAIMERFGVESIPNTLVRKTGEQERFVNRQTGNLEPSELRSSGPELLVPLRASGTRPPLFLIHPPGGIVICYQPLAQCLATDQPVYGIRARGLHHGEELPSRLEFMATEYCAALRTLQPEGPYLLGGWSLGGVIALEIAQQLLSAGQRVDLLAFLDTTIPHGEANRAFNAETESSGLEYGFDVTLEELAALPSEQQLPYLWRHVERLGLIDRTAPEEVIHQILDDLKQVFHNHVQLASEYVVRPYPGKITLFRPEDAPVDVMTRHDRGWGQLAAEVEIHSVPGQHHTMVKPPHVGRLAEILEKCLAKVPPAHSS